MRRALTALAVLAVFAALLYGVARYSLHAECEACVEVDGASSCRDALAATQREAALAALTNACSIVTRAPRMRRECVASQTRSVRCREF